ncbi:DUF1566 domain-containing protein [Leptospira terpstrae]|uniref:Lcl C-terminal domain-containing protein n=1 Tax=Leptospira terpstrae TaxID=293075 RepID=UPI003D065FBC
MTDVATGLVWQKCSWGQTGSDCSGSTAVYDTWPVALNHCHGLTLASRTWRLPNIIELQSILDVTKASGALIDTTIFPATGLLYWSSTNSNSFGSTAAWLVVFGSSGYVLDELKVQGAANIRCVSGP